jgi:tetratricopeptide (TPR) repeat protein
MIARGALIFVAVLTFGMAIAQQPPPPSPSSESAPPPPPAGVSPELAEATRLLHDGQHAAALAKIDAVLASDAKNPQARFLRGVVLSDDGQIDDAAAIFEGLTEDYPELPEPHNNLAVIWAQQGKYDKARTALETALAARPDYAIAHENLGDVYSRMAGAQYEQAISLDKTDKSAQAKLVIVRELYAVTPSTSPPNPAEPKLKAAPKAKK